MNRRKFITLLGGAAAAWPLVAGAQQIQVIGFINSGSPDNQMVPFRQGLNETGYVEGRNVVVEYRWAENRDDRLPALVADLVAQRVAVIVANTPSALVAKRLTATIPIVFTTGADPVSVGLVARINRPEANITGVSFFANKLEAKRLGLLHELVPSATLIAYFIQPNFPDAAEQLEDVQEAGRTLGLRIYAESVSNAGDIDSAFATITLKGINALLVGAGPLLNRQRHQIVAHASRYRIPAIYEGRQSAEAGGLATYGTSLIDAYRQAGIYTGRILAGAKPADLPVQQPTRFELVINVKTAKALRLEIAPTLLARADEVIE
jgi:putative ABC transport system substrate-binding protein